MLFGCIGLNLALTTLCGFWIGQALDHWLHSDPVCLIIGVLVGLAAGIYSIMKLIKPFME